MLSKIPRMLCTVFLTVILCACGSGTATISDRDASITAAARTAARTATTLLASPTPSLSPTANASPTLSPTQTPTKNPALPTSANISLCDNSGYVSDVTFLDGTDMDPGDTFTKTWKIRNTGECDWTTGYKLDFVSGTAMGGSATALPNAVEAGDSADVSVELTAPGTPGSYTGYWRLKNAAGAFFGDLVYVQIVVSGGGTVTTTPPATSPAASATAVPTLTPTQTPTSG